MKKSKTTTASTGTRHETYDSHIKPMVDKIISLFAEHKATKSDTEAVLFAVQHQLGTALVCQSQPNR